MGRTFWADPIKDIAKGTMDTRLLSFSYQAVAYCPGVIKPSSSLIQDQIQHQHVLSRHLLQLSFKFQQHQLDS